ncbi:CRISPR-associated endonuclease Cas2 [Corticibacterium sp. UT-5YL-CI-8]|nr:CRISPR-associated endonuclease Cas2 [Tianweitania sp. UT-5YL-CI-8]
MTTFYTQQGGGEPTHLSAYRLMWMLVTFDLPVETKKQRKAAGAFRLHLLDLGFEMSQLSNYLRICNGKEQFDAYIRKIESSLPERGDIFVFQFTDRQYENIVRFSDQSRRKRSKNPEQLALF